MQVPESLFIKKIKAGVLGERRLGEKGKRGLGEKEKWGKGDLEIWEIPALILH
jgi:hypothetical protein